MSATSDGVGCIAATRDSMGILGGYTGAWLASPEDEGMTASVVTWGIACAAMLPAQHASLTAHATRREHTTPLQTAGRP